MLFVHTLLLNEYVNLYVCWKWKQSADPLIIITKNNENFIHPSVGSVEQLSKNTWPSCDDSKKKKKGNGCGMGTWQTSSETWNLVCLAKGWWDWSQSMEAEGILGYRITWASEKLSWEYTISHGVLTELGEWRVLRAARQILETVKFIVIATVGPQVSKVMLFKPLILHCF